MAELRDLYDINSNKTDKTYYKGDIIPEGYYPMVVMAVIRNSNGEFLMQKRVESKGGDWGVTGGHPKSGQTPEEGIITEVSEELGIDISNDKLIEYASGCDGKDCYKMYFINKDIDINDIVIQEEELTEVRWFTMEQLDNMVRTNELNEDQVACFRKVCNYFERSIKVKICANKSIEDAKMCIEAGADIIGLLVGQEHTSNDFIDKETAKEIAEYAKGKCDISLVTHLTNADEIISLTKYIGNNVIQLHSDINEDEVEKIVKELPNIKLVRLIHISSDGEIITNYKNMKYADFYLLDSFNLKTNQVGGTGLTHDWNKSRELIEKLDKPTFLAGGLNPDNVKLAIETAKPYGVDVNSGCKNDKGVKDKDKVTLFVHNAKSIIL